MLHRLNFGQFGGILLYMRIYAERVRGDVRICDGLQGMYGRGGL